MKIILFGATGMVGRGALRECLLDPSVERVLAIGRSATGQAHAKLREILRPDMFDYSDLAQHAADIPLTEYDACFFCLGVSSAGMTEQAYTRVTYDLTMAAAQALVTLNPRLTFLYVSGLGTDSSERGRSMWARIKGRTENALLRLPFRAAYMLRPGYIQPLHGIRSKTKLYQALYAVAAPLYPLLRILFPNYATTTEQLGHAMIRVAEHGYPQRVLASRDINAIH